ncbi:MAG: type II toxin-antitoxin system YafQ family toxin [Bacteroidota bacterium]|nr:type II toxin-antitoxin system YafQ family toxin [Bacteroidota bacterium]
MYEIIATNQFSKDYKRCIKRNYNIILLDELIILLSETGTVPSKHKPHPLSGNLNGHHECHIKTDWLLIWTKNDFEKTISLIATGTHSDLFR